MNGQGRSWHVQGREVTDSDLEWIRCYLGLSIIGENIGYLIGDRNGRDLAALLFGAAAWRCAARDRYIGWTDRQRQAGLSGMANNTRFLILPWVRVPHLASHVLGTIQRRISGPAASA